MFILPDNWELASLLAKLLFYVGAFSIAGGSLTAWRYSSGNRALLFSIFSYIFVGTVLAFHGVLLGFLVQVGLINDSGLAGMFDWGMISILLDTDLGDVTMLRLLAFLVAGVSSVIAIRRLQRSNIDLQAHQTRLMFLMQPLALLALAYSLRVTGHVSVLSIIAQVSIVLHFIAFALWIGCLYPFLQLSRSLDLQLLQLTLKRFGDNAIAILCVLFLGGVLMAFELLQSPMDLLTTSYGVALLVKLGLVLIIMGIAAMNKLMIVPAILSGGSTARLQTSIRYELAIAMVILLVTSYLSTIVGPAGHQM
ncbi:MAG: copper resistance protein D [Pseudohongiella sp.]|nr:MAG: copper resistance protein D [Pseudohongiella sp.]